MTTQIIYQKNFIADIDGKPLDNGLLYIGIANQDPEVSPLTVYWDSALTQVATQPLSISAGAVVHNGARAAIYTGAASYSFRAKNGSGYVVDYVADANDPVVTLSNNLASNTSSKGTDMVAAHDIWATTYLETTSDIINGESISLLRFIDPTKHAGIRAGSNTDDLKVSLQTAAAAAKCIFVPFGTYHTSDAVAISKDGARWHGDGVSAAIIKSNVNNKAIFTINSGLNGVTFEGFQLSRTVTAISGGDGIVSDGVSIGQAMIRRMLIQSQYLGLNLGPTDYSEVEKVIIQKCQSIGVRVRNTAADGACQWSFDSVLSQMNAAQGFLWQSQAGPSQMTTGTMKNCATFANTGVGIGYAGSVGVPIPGVRIHGGFHGENGDHCIYLDTYGDQHFLSPIYVELAGTRTTGPTLSTAASHTGDGINITSNNGVTQINGTNAYGNSLNGMFLNGSTDIVTSSRATDNGAANSAGNRNGIRSTAGVVICTTSRLGNTGAGTSQEYGAFITDGNNLSLGFNHISGNTVAPWGATSNVTYVASMGNLPNTLSVGLAPAGPVLVGGGATGGFTAAGEINVGAGLRKNNTAYTNP